MDTTKIQLLRTSEISERNDNHKLDEGEPLVIKRGDKYTDLIIGDGGTTLKERKSINALTVTSSNDNKEVVLQVGEYDKNNVTFSSGDNVNFERTDNKVTIGVNNKLSLGTDASISVGGSGSTYDSIKISGTNGISVTTDGDTINIKSSKNIPQMIIGKHSIQGTVHTITVPEALYGDIVICYVVFKVNYSYGDTITVKYEDTVYVDEQIPNKTDGDTATVDSFVGGTCSQIILFKYEGSYKICIPSATPVWYSNQEESDGQ